jgi:hypothetical protein
MVGAQKVEEEERFFIFEIMKQELIIELLQKFEQAAYEYQGVECWSARELQMILG